jgi:hypothetical protein
MALYFTDGVDPVTAYGQKSELNVIGSWVEGDTWKLELTSTLTGDATFGHGWLDASEVTYGLTFQNRVYLACGTKVNFSGLANSLALGSGDVTGWNEQNVGAGFFSTTSRYGSQDSVVSFATYQGSLVLFCANQVQIWTVTSDPAQFNLTQVLTNTGTKAKLSVCSYGDLDVFYLDANGIRSLRPRETSLNAYVEDIGTPVDTLVQAKLASCTTEQVAAACGVVDPVSKRYILFIKDTFYVLSNFPRSEIMAWSTYLASANALADDLLIGSVEYDDSGEFEVSGLTVGNWYYWTKTNTDSKLVYGNDGQMLTASGYFKALLTTVMLQGIASQTSATKLQPAAAGTFVPEKFVVYNGVIYMRTVAGELIAHGGSSGTTYDGIDAVIETAWLDFGKPTVVKLLQAVDISMLGSWKIEVCSDPASDTFITVYNPEAVITADSDEDSTFDKKRIPCELTGTHFKLRATSTGNGKAKISEIAFHFQEGDKD